VKANEQNTGLLTVREVALLLRVRPGAVYGWIHDGLLEAMQLPAKKEHAARPRYRIARASVDAMLQKEHVSE